MVDRLRLKLGSGVVAIGSVQDGSAVTVVGVTPDLFTGDKETDFDMDYDTAATVVIQGQSPLPMTVLSISPSMVGE